MTRVLWPDSGEKQQLGMVKYGETLMAGRDMDVSPGSLRDALAGFSTMPVSRGRADLCCVLQGQWPLVLKAGSNNGIMQSAVSGEHLFCDRCQLVLGGT